MPATAQEDPLCWTWRALFVTVRVKGASLTRWIGRLEESGCGSLSAQRGWRLGTVELAEVVVHLEGGGDDDVDVGDGDVGDDGVDGE